MALPQQLKTARATDGTVASTIDNVFGALESAIADILGITVDTDVTASALSANNAGQITKALVAQRAAPPVGWRFRDTANSREFRLALNNTSILIDENTGSEGAPTWTNRITIALGSGTFAAAKADRLSLTVGSAIALASGDNHNVLIGDVGIVKLTPHASGSSVTGFVAGFSGQIIFVYSTNSNSLTYKHDIGSITANRLYLPSNVNLGPNSDSWRANAFSYDAVTSKWLQLLRG